MKILLGRKEFNPDKPDTNGQIPLSHAAQSGYEGVGKLLLPRGDVNPGNVGYTP